MIEPIVIAGPFAAASGAAFGSFASTLAVRMDANEGALFGRSRCDACHAPLGYLATVPVLSWVQRGGACSVCGARIPTLHLAGELSGAAAGLAVVLVATTPLQASLLAVLLFALLTAALVDWRTMTLPDLCTAVIAVAAAGLAYLRSPMDLLTGLATAAIAFAVLEAVRRGFRAAQGKSGLGFGDVKLVAALGIWLGTLTSWAVALAALLGLVAFKVLKPSGGRLPFGPWLVLGAAVVGLSREAGLWPTFG